MQIIPVQTRLFRVGENLQDFIVEYVPTIQSGDIVVVTSKIVALAQGRVIAPGFNKNQIVAGMTDEVVETPWCLLSRSGMDWCANAGVDESNAGGSLILLPEHPRHAALTLRDGLSEQMKHRDFGVLLTDTRIVPLRQGTMGMALAWAGVDPIKDYVGTEDLYGRKLKMTKANIVHALAAAAVLVMGEGAESAPLVIIRDSGIPIEPAQSGEVGDIAILPEDDLYRYLYEAKTDSMIDKKPIS